MAATVGQLRGVCHLISLAFAPLTIVPVLLSTVTFGGCEREQPYHQLCIGLCMVLRSVYVLPRGTLMLHAFHNLQPFLFKSPVTATNAPDREQRMIKVF